MKLAIISVTTAGNILAKSLKRTLEEDPSFVKIDIFHKNVRETLKNIFHSYDAILGIMASGIMIRSICGLLQSKTSDPAVLVMNESSKHIISLISGHLGGANNLTIKIANLTGADPVITTATDIHNIMGIDALAQKYFWEIENPENIRYFNRALLNGEKIELKTDLDIEYIFNDYHVTNSYYITQISDLDNKITNNSVNDNLKNNSKENSAESNFSTINHDVFLEENIIAAFNDKTLTLKPKKMVAGIGSRKGVSKDQVCYALKESLKILDLTVHRLDTLATAEIKSDENGIIECAESLGLNLTIISLNDIKSFESSQCDFSEFVNHNFGVGGVCEPCALISAGPDAKLIFKKTPYNGVTVAIAVF